MDEQNQQFKQVPHQLESPNPSPPPKADKKRLIVLIVVLVLAVAAASATWWIKRDTKPKINSFAECKAAGNPIAESYPEQCLADGQTFINPDQKRQTDQNNETQTEPAQEDQKYLTITEWNVRVPISKATNTEDMVYRYVKNESYESVFFTFQRLIDYGICEEDAGVAMSRSTEKNNPPYDIENPEQFKQVAPYYYSFAYANGGPCYNEENQAETDFYESTKITKNTITEAVKNLEAVPE